MREKILDSELEDFAALTGSHKKRSVIVELSSAPPKVPLRKPERRSHPFTGIRPGRTDKRSYQAKIRNVEGHQKEMDRLNDQLSELGISEEDLTRLDTAQAFIVTVNPEQLRNIVKLNLIGSIRPNRTHRL